jgi:4-amino-4-deoxychorismate synthase (2-amino-4-deoxychorismate-forming) component I
LSSHKRETCIVRRYDGWPDLLSLARSNPERYPCLLENSAQASSDLGRYDILFAFPGDTLISMPDGPTTFNGQPVGENNFIQQLNKICSENSVPDDDREFDLPFTGGWFLYLGYELAAEIEPVLAASLATPEMPRGVMTQIPAGIVCDKHSHECYLFANGIDAELMLEKIQADCLETSDFVQQIGGSSVCELREEGEAQFISGVDRIKQYISAGDVFQVNLSRSWKSDESCALSPCDAYARLRETNPAPFSCFARLNEHNHVLSSSPERLVEVRQGVVRTRPIAGTYPRAADQAEDQRLSAELLMHPKERAEHIMLVDLERNDLGRICRPGTVHVPELMVIESYEYVHHIVSEVSGELCKGVLPGDIISAVFPGGTITGCPKIHCMEIIAELEQSPRDAYTGSVGYLCNNGDMDLNILIRTITSQDGKYSLRAGAGIVADSDPAREIAETRAKAQGMCRVFADA